jgi:hypothetical protein
MQVQKAVRRLVMRPINEGEEEEGQANGAGAP